MANTFIVLGSMVGSFLTIGGLAMAIIKWILKQNKQSEDIEILREQHNEDIEEIKKIGGGHTVYQGRIVCDLLRYACFARWSHAASLQWECHQSSWPSRKASEQTGTRSAPKR